MKLSTKGRYGLKIMYDLAIKSGETSLSTTMLAEDTGITVAYLEKLMSLLKKADLVCATRGNAGGYSLNRKPSEITIGSILRALEGNLFITDCVNDKCSDERCPNKSVFKKIYYEINNVLDGMSLQDMVDDNHKK